MPHQSRRDLLFALPVVVAIAVVAVIALSGSGDSNGEATATGSPGVPASGELAPRWQLATEIANAVQAKGLPRGLAECIGERAVVSSTPSDLARIRTDTEYAETRSEVVSPACERSYIGPATTPDPTPIVIDPQASPSRFAAAVDAICAVDFNGALLQETEINHAASERNWSYSRTKSADEYIWAASEGETARYVANLGAPPAAAATIAHWRANVAQRAGLFRAKGDAWKRGDETRALRINDRIMGLKEEADRLGDSFGLRVCTSN